MDKYEKLEAELEAFLKDEDNQQYIVDTKDLDDDLLQPENLQQSDDHHINNSQSMSDMMYPYPPGFQMETPKKKFGAFLMDLLFYILLIGIVFGAFVYTSKQKGAVSLMGYSPMIVETGSMEPEIPTFSLIIAKHVPPEEIMMGDDITFRVGETRTFTHRVIEVIDSFEDTGEKAFKTQGIANESPDKDVAVYPNVVGKVIYVLPNVGVVFSWIQNNIKIVLILMVLLLALSFTIKMYLEADRQEKLEKKQLEMMRKYHEINSKQKL